MRDYVPSNIVTAVLLALLIFAAAAVAPSRSHAVTFNNISSGRPTPTAAPVTAISVAPTAPTATVYAGTDGGGVYTITVGGTSWSAANYQLTSREVQAVAIHPADPTVIYTGTKAGLFRSTDGGGNWSAINTGLGNTTIRALAITPTSTVLGSTVVFAGTAAGVYRSTDGGATWGAVNTGLTNSDIRALRISGTNIYAGTGDGIFSSPLSSIGWSSAGLSGNIVTSLAAGAASTIFAGTSSGGIYSSTDGTTWNSDSSGLSNLLIYALAVDSSGNNAYAGTAGGLFSRVYSTSWGNWSATGSGITTPNTIRAIATANGSRVYAGTDLGIFTSANGGSSWSAVNSGLIAGRAVAVSPSDPTVLTGGFSAGGAYSSSNRGDNWGASTSGLTNQFVTALFFDPVTSGLVYAATGAGVFKSVDSGQNWTDITGNLTNRNVRALAIGPAATPALHAGTAGGVFTWDGANWSTHSGGLTGSLDVTSLAFNGTSLLAGTNGGSIYRSVGGAAWTQLLTGLSSSNITALEVDSAGGYIYAGTNAGVHKSTTADNGDSWTRITNGTTDDIRSLAVKRITPPAPADPMSVLVAGTSAGAFSTTDAGATWTSIPRKTADSLIRGVALDADWPQHLHAATGRGLATTQLTPIMSVTPASGYLINPAHINSPKVQQYTLTNTGTIDLTITDYTITHTLVAPPTLTTGGTAPCSNLPAVGTPLVLRPNQSCTLQFSFTPTIPGNSNATITFNSNDIASPSRAYVLNWIADDPLPIALITSPTTGESVKTPRQVVGIASDVGSGLQNVLISLDGGTNWVATTQTIPGSWSSWQYDWSPLTEGSYSLQAKGVDNNGNETAPLTTLTVYVDNTAPSATLSSPAANAAVRGATATVSGTAADPVTAGAGSGINKVQVSTDGGVNWLDATGTTSWTFTWTLPSDGLYDIVARAIDKAGNQANSVNTNQVRVDNTPPSAVAITAPSAGQTLPTGTSYTITGTASDSGSGISLVEISTDNGTTWHTANYNVADDTWSYPWTLPVNGTYQLLARATDRAGNSTTTSASSAVINNPLPTSIITSPAPGAQLHGATVSITLTAQVTVPNLALSMVEVSLGGGAWQQSTCLLLTAPGVTPADYSCSYSPALPQDYFNASYTIRSRAVDAIGNIQTPTYDVTVLVDNKLPTSAITSPANGAYLQRSAQIISGSASDLEPLQGLGIQLVELSFDSGLNWSSAVGTASWSASWTPASDGTYTVLARATDLINNQQNPLTSITLYIDGVPPTASFSSTPHNPSNSLTPSFTFISNEPANFTCTLKDAASNTTISTGYCGCTPNATSFAASCTESFTIGSSGSYSVTVTPVDRAGNTGSSIIYPWVIDTSSVILNSVSPADNATLVSTSTTITATFSKDIDPTTIETASGANRFQLNNGITGTVTYDPATFTATFTPNPRVGRPPLDYGTTYTATLTTGISDTAGNSLLGAPISWSFSTDPDGDINGDGRVTIVDALLALYLTVGKMSMSEVAAMRPAGSQTTAAVMGHGDVAPLSGGRPNPDGIIEARDAMVILGKSIGIHNW